MGYSHVVPPATTIEMYSVWINCASQTGFGEVVCPSWVSSNQFFLIICTCPSWADPIERWTCLDAGPMGSGSEHPLLTILYYLASATEGPAPTGCGPAKTPQNKK